MIKEGDLFAGLIPRILFEAGTIFIGKTLIHLYRQNGDGLEQYTGQEKDSKIVEVVINYATSACKSFYTPPACFLIFWKFP